MSSKTTLRYYVALHSKEIGRLSNRQAFIQTDRQTCRRRHSRRTNIAVLLCIKAVISHCCLTTSSIDRTYETSLVNLFEPQDIVEGCVARQAVETGHRHSHREDTHSQKLKWQLYKCSGCQRDQMHKHICRPVGWQGLGMRLGVCPLAPSASIPSAPLAVQPCKTGADTVSVCWRTKGYMDV